MCAACQAEYEDPLDRRFHAQPNACPVCGPQARLVERDGTPASVSEVATPCAPPPTTCSPGGCWRSRASAATTSPAAPTTRPRSRALRTRKHREDRPFALLVASVDAARELVTLDDAEAALLSSRERPIVLASAARARKAAGRAVGRAARAGARADAALHAAAPLLAGDVGVPIVLTSGNVSDEPIAFEDDDALERLAPIADRFLVHDRPIATRTDDSVARVVRGAPLLLRRSRGYVPASLELPVAASRAAAGLRRRAEGRVLPGVGHARLGQPPHRRHQELRDAALAAGRRRALRAAVRGDARGRRARPAPRLPLHALRAGARGRRARRRPAPPRPPRGDARRARRARTGGRRDLRRHGLRDRRHGVGRRAARRAASTATSAPATCALCACRAASARSASRGGWGCAWLVELHGDDVAPPPALAGIDPKTWQAVVRMVRRARRRR